MTCSQCHIRNFGMHDYSRSGERRSEQGHAEGAEQAARDAQLPDHPDDALGGVHARLPAAPGVPRQDDFEQFLGADAAKGLTCPLAK